MISITQDITKANAITHGGLFHADDVLSAVALEKVFGNLTLFRTFRVPENVDDSVIVFDIGFGKYDHHQKNGNGIRENGIPYASAGLLWKDFGMRLLNRHPYSQCAKEIWNKLDNNLFCSFDAYDNGVSIQSNSSFKTPSVSSLISYFNSNWTEDISNNDAFLQACDFMRAIFDRMIIHTFSQVRAKEHVEHAIDSSREHIVVLDKFMPWKESLLDSNNPKASEVMFVVYPDKRNGWAWQCVPKRKDDFSQRLSVPKAWRGLCGKDLQEVTGIKTAVFCHAGGFIGAAKTKQDAIEMARLAIKNGIENNTESNTESSHVSYYAVHIDT